jgi:hypothetical protein
MALFGAMTINTRRRPSAPFSVTVDIVAPEQAVSYPASFDVPVPDGAAVRAVPLLSILNAGEERLVVVGDIRVTVHRDLRTNLTVVVRGLWLTDAGESPAGPTATDWRMEMSDDRLTDLLGAVIRGVPYGGHPDPEGLATQIAKAHAEKSRDGIRALRSFRYCMEHLVGSSLRGSTHKLEGILADVVELSTLIGRVADEAREAARGGMGAWITNPAAYHAQRRLQDPALPPAPAPAARNGRRGSRSSTPAYASATPWRPRRAPRRRCCTACSTPRPRSPSPARPRPRRRSTWSPRSAVSCSAYQR